MFENTIADLSAHRNELADRATEFEDRAAGTTTRNDYSGMAVRLRGRVEDIDVLIDGLRKDAAAARKGNAE